MKKTQLPGLGRRGFLLGGAAVGAGALLTACTGNSDDNSSEAVVGTGGGDNAAPGKAVTIGFAAPAADHGWIAAITNNAKAQADQFDDVTLNAVEGSNDVNTQVTQMQQLVSDWRQEFVDRSIVRC